MSHFNYTDEEKLILSESIVILIDKDEKENTHITDWLDKYSGKVQTGIKHKTKKMNVGDYSFYLPKNIELSIPRDIHFENDIIIERKNGLKELSGNLTKYRKRFENEWGRCQTQLRYLLVESGSLEDIIKHRYDTLTKPKAYINSIIALEQRHNLHVQFVNPQIMGNMIFAIFKRFLIDWLDNELPGELNEQRDI